MDLLLEFILELILEGSIEISSNKKIPKWIRYPLIFIITALFLTIIIGILFLGMYMSKENILLSILLIIISIFLLIGSIKKLKDMYIEKKENKK